MAVKLKGWRFAVFMGAFVSAILTPLYFTAYQPMENPSYYKNIREAALPKLPSKHE